MTATDVGDPVETSLHRQPGQHAVLGLVAIRGGNGHSPTLVVQRLLAVLVILVPGLGDQEPDSGPLIHHRVGQDVELLLAALEER